MARKTTLLKAVNRVLTNIGQAPTTTLIGGNPLVEMAESILAEVNIAVQAEGWIFNSEYGYPFNIQEDGTILVPVNVLALDGGRGSSKFLIIRDGKLYDKAAHSYIFTEQQKLDVTWLFDFDDLPEAAKEYITIRAGNVFAGRSVGSSEAVAFGQREELMSRATLMEYDTQQGDYNVFNTNDGYTQYNSYNPINVLRGY